MFLWLLLGSIGFGALKFALFLRLDMGIELGLRFEAIAHPGHFPAWYAALEAVFDLALIVVAIARLHDIDRSGWWLAGIAGIGSAAVWAILGPLYVLSLILWLALLFWPGTFGPNRYGAHPLGWESREQYEAQMRALREHVPPGKG